MQSISRAIGSSSHWGLIMMPGQETNGDNLGHFFIFKTVMVCWVYSLELPQWGDSFEYIEFSDEIRKFPYILVFWSDRKIFEWAQKGVWIALKGKNLLRRDLLCKKVNPCYRKLKFQKYPTLSISPYHTCSKIWTSTIYYLGPVVQS